MSYVATTFTRTCGFLIGHGFTTKHDQNNPHNKYTVVVLSVDAKSRRKVEHLPREISKECFLFILHGGTLMLWQSTGRITTAYLSCGLFRSCFVMKLNPGGDPTHPCKHGSHVWV